MNIERRRVMIDVMNIKIHVVWETVCLSLVVVVIIIDVSDIIGGGVICWGG